MARLINHIELINRQGDITKQSDVDVIVNAANAQLRTGGGVAGAIHRAAGPDLERAAIPLGPIQPGEAVITEAFRLPNKYIIHCLGPVYGKDKPEAKILGNCYREALKLADDYQMTSIAFPAISTGIFGYPVEEAAKVAFSSIMAILPELKSIRKIYFVLFGDNDFRIHEEELKRLIP
ncbi:macro domain-containing protein [Echinicola sp. CAU 1574]|uniref:Macro domain-containing protein n=1 Tax=Echinicola arenosa TaxID=2774144 RepID=A0ABR9AI62_9BACT|nr:macro domain-containing protein [Echinicola arenosa]MBD8488410.1 macro domain-containing protein [Echinicola arenosa]